MSINAVKGVNIGAGMHSALLTGIENSDEIIFDDTNVGPKPKWMSETSLNNLNDVLQLYCKGRAPLKKAKRDVFVKGTSEEIRNDLQSLLTYCGMDVLATSKIFAQLYPQFRERSPHPATTAGMLEMALAYLPVNTNWNHYKRQSDDTAEDLEEETQRVLAHQAKDTCQLLVDSEAFKHDLWMWDQDWGTKDLKMKRNVKNAKLTNAPKLSSNRKSGEKTLNFEELAIVSFILLRSISWLG